MKRVAKDHPIRPVLVVQVELSPVDAFRNAVEVGEEVGHDLAGFVPAARECHAAVRRLVPSDEPSLECKAEARR